MSHPVRVCSTLLLAALTSCHRGAKTGNAPDEPVRALAAYGTQRIVLAPTARVTFSSTDSLIRAVGTGQAAGRYFDDELALRLRERGLASSWILPADLRRAHERNRTYAPDPDNLAVEPVQSSRFEIGSKYGEPLSTQLRTMIALHEQGRYVLLPIQLRLHQSGRTVLRLALLDPRFAEARWVGNIVSDSTSVQSAAGLTQVARRVADLFAAP